ncbi:MAG: hypothetical protein ACYC6Y_25340 [Thermoguttaceae bacterium]
MLLPDAHVSGKAKVVVQDAKAYQQLLDRLEAADAEEILRERLASLDAGEPGVSAEEVLSALRSLVTFGCWHIFCPIHEFAGRAQI